MGVHHFLWRVCTQQRLLITPEMRLQSDAEFDPTVPGVYYIPLTSRGRRRIEDKVSDFINANGLVPVPLFVSNDSTGISQSMYRYLVDKLFIGRRDRGLSLLDEFLESRGVPREVRQQAEAITDRLIHEITPAPIAMEMPMIQPSYRGT
jgi:hypothetical protein